jgi:hypothetical protein
VRHSTKILLAGLGLSALVLAVSYMNTWRLERRLSALQAECQRSTSSNAAAHGPWEKYAAHGPDTVPVRMPDGTVVRLPNKVDHGTGKELRAESDEATARTAGVDQKATLHVVPDPPEAYFVPPDKVPPGANVFDQFDNPPPKWALDYVRASTMCALHIRNIRTCRMKSLAANLTRSITVRHGHVIRSSATLTNWCRHPLMIFLMVRSISTTPES